MTLQIFAQKSKLLLLKFLAIVLISQLAPIMKSSHGTFIMFIIVLGISDAMDCLGEKIFLIKKNLLDLMRESILGEPAPPSFDGRYFWQPFV